MHGFPANARFFRRKTARTSPLCVSADARRSAMPASAIGAAVGGVMGAAASLVNFFFGD